jgi:tetratricopeptide (TPR) repeat protein
MEGTWKPTAAGILCIIGGTIGAVVGLIVVFFIWLGGAFLEFFLKIASEPNQEIPAVASFEAGVLIVILIIATLAIVGGIYALRRRIWGLALAGSICALVPLVIPGILAIIFVSLSKREFESGAMVEEETTADYSKAILLNPNDADAYYNRGCAYSEKGEVDKAVSDLKRCIELSTDRELTKAAQQELRKMK